MREETLDPQDWEAFGALAHEMVDQMIDVQRRVRELSRSTSCPSASHPRDWTKGP